MTILMRKIWIDQVIRFLLQGRLTVEQAAFMVANRLKDMSYNELAVATMLREAAEILHDIVHNNISKREYAPVLEKILLFA